MNMALTVEEIEAVMGGPAKPPIRVFVGLETRATTSERADLAMRELEALGAFERKHIVFMSPTGTGYLNYVTAESLEFLTRGDVALVAMQYSLRPSPLSLFRVGIGIDQNNAFLHALKWRLAAIPEEPRPKLHIFGESLGAQTSEDVFAEEGTEGLHRVGIDRGLFLGTPAATKFRQSWLSDPAAMDPDGEIVEVDNYRSSWPCPRTSAPGPVLLPDPSQRLDAQVLVPAGGPGPRLDGPGRDPRARRPQGDRVAALHHVPDHLHRREERHERHPRAVRRQRPRLPRQPGAVHLPGLRPARRRRHHHQTEPGPRRPGAQMGRERVIDQEYADAQTAVAEQLAKWGVAPTAPIATDSEAVG